MRENMLDSLFSKENADVLALSGLALLFGGLGLALLWPDKRRR